MPKQVYWMLASALALSGGLCNAADEDCKFTAQRSASIDTAGAERVEVTARAGDLEVKGRKGVSKVDAGGKACASSQAYLDQIQIDTRRDGAVVHVDVRMPKMEDDADSQYALLDLKVELPDTLPLVLLDSSGDTHVSNVASANVTDSSGDLTIMEVARDLEVRDSSGDMRVEHVGGNMRLNDSSGDIHLDDIQGEVTVAQDSSGDMTIERVGKNVHVEQDSSGDITVARVQGNVQIDSDGSGEVDVNDITGGFTLNAKGSGDVRVANVKGTVQVPPSKQ